MGCPHYLPGDVCFLGHRRVVILKVFWGLVREHEYLVLIHRGSTPMKTRVKHSELSRRPPLRWGVA